MNLIPEKLRTSELEDGDFLWPKEPSAFVPYSQTNVDVSEDQRIWECEKHCFLQRTKRGQTTLTTDQLLAIRAMDYDEFLASYHGSLNPDAPGAHAAAAGGLYVGHVAIVHCQPHGEVSVVEALWGKVVQIMPFKNWVNERSDQTIWHGRLRGYSRTDRICIAQEAVNYLGRPYEFWNFDLGDDSGFYCSKLCWLAVFRGLSIAIDNNPNPLRGFWFSPKQMLHSASIERLNDPGAY